jgi:hypothetical protein
MYVVAEKITDWVQVRGVRYYMRSTSNHYVVPHIFKEAEVFATMAEAEAFRQRHYDPSRFEILTFEAAEHYEKLGGNRVGHCTKD